MPKFDLPKNWVYDILYFMCKLHVALKNLIPLKHNLVIRIYNIVRHTSIQMKRFIKFII